MDQSIGQRKKYGFSIAKEFSLKEGTHTTIGFTNAPEIV